MNIPLAGRRGRLHATTPLVRLEVGADGLTFAPRWFGRFLVRPYRVPLADLAGAFRLRSSLLTAGVGFERRDGQRLYFWTTSQQAAVLDAVASLGIPIDPETHQFHRWRPGSSSPREQSGAQLTAAMNSLMPVGLVASVPMLAFLETRPGPLVWHVWIGIVWVVGVTMTVRTLLARRRD